MHEREMARVQRKSAERIVESFPVHRVAHDRMSRLGKMHANLIAAAGFERHVEHRKAASRRGRAVVRDRFFSRHDARHALHAQFLILGQKRMKRAGRLGEFSVHDRDVNPLDVMRGKQRLQPVAHVTVLREDEHA